MGLRRACWLEMRKVLLAGDDLAGLLDPILAEGRLHPVDDRPLDAQTGVAPVILVLPMPGPLLGESISADVAGTAVDDGLFAMVAIIEPAEVRKSRQMESHEVNAGVE